MTALNEKQKQLLFDHSLGLTSEFETADVEKLLASSQEAVQIHRSLRSALSPLDSLEPEVCPDELAEGTVLRLMEQARTANGRDRLGELLATEQREAARIRIPFWRNWSEVVTAAAAVVLFVSILLPTLGFTRQKYWQRRCQTNLGGIYAGVAGYVADHDGRFPRIATTPGSPWWRVGYQGQENHSNTRRAWLLVRQEYVRPDSFMCAGRRGDRPDFRALDVAQYNDFPGRIYIHFSVRICCPQATEQGPMSKRVLMADLSPVCEGAIDDHSRTLDIELCDALMTSNSRNHRGKGQNVLLCDGSVEYTKTRHTSFSDDDIYTLQAMSCGQRVRGYEVPSCEEDTFVAP